MKTDLNFGLIFFSALAFCMVFCFQNCADKVATPAEIASQMSVSTGGDGAVLFKCWGADGAAGTPQTDTILVVEGLPVVGSPNVAQVGLSLSLGISEDNSPLHLSSTQTDEASGSVQYLAGTNAPESVSLTVNPDMSGSLSYSLYVNGSNQLTTQQVAVTCNE